ncbi:LpqB family beta-propeller domain-containing protein [Arthrobacter sp. KK5.5]|uniref:LpqB family beta-propeller domain-containing protein n=1 Tax=Arthrobacter sp. KK5.5 TaxID=3373084 RepID=UPI003EE65509
MPRTQDERRGGGRFHGVPVRALVAMLAAVVLLAAGCGSIPVRGPVGTIGPEGQTESEFQYAFTPPGPEDGAGPDEIIAGFYRAGISPQDDYKVAREYLAPELARSWQSTARTLVYDSEPNVVSNVEEGSYTIELAVVATIDEHGILTRSPENATESVEVALTEVEDEWRISAAPDGTLVEQGNFPVLFSPYALYFYDSTLAYAIPDYRWFANRQSLAAPLVESMLAGPAPYLRNAVRTAFPEDSELARAAVPVDARHATVDFADGVFADTTELHRQQMQQQLELTLAGVGNISSVTMTVGQRAVSLGDTSPDFVNAVVNPAVPDTQVAVADKQLVYYQGNGVQAVVGVGDISSHDPRDPAMSPGGNRFAFLNGDRSRLFTVGEGGAVRRGASGKSLLAPSIDIHGWTWTVDPTDRTHVYAVPEDRSRHGEVREVAAAWMDNAVVSSLRISRDGARAVVVAEIDGEAGVYVSGVIRDTEGVPRGFTEPSRLPSTVPVGKAVWDSATSVIVMAPDNEQPVEAERIPLAGDSEVFQPLLGMTGISAAPGEQRTVYAETPEGVYSRVSNLWKKQAGQARYLAYPG